jgi:hypothetical protein
MSLDLVFYDGKGIEAGVTVNISFSNDGFKELIDLGLGRVPTCTAPDGVKCIDLKIFKIKVAEIFNKRKIPHPQAALVELTERHHYLAVNP